MPRSKEELLVLLANCDEGRKQYHKNVPVDMTVARVIGEILQERELEEIRSRFNRLDNADLISLREHLYGTNSKEKALASEPESSNQESKIPVLPGILDNRHSRGDGDTRQRTKEKGIQAPSQPLD